jgi:hypothetical protein
MSKDAMESAETATLIILRDNLWNGLAVIGQHFIDGTAHVSKDPVKGSASPAQFGGALVLPLFFKINTILVARGEEDYTARLNA